VMMRNIAEQVRQVTSFLSKVHGLLDLIANDKFGEALQQLAQTTSDDEALQALVTTFSEMIQSIQAREARLK